MPGSNAGTGHPLTFRCAKCKVCRPWKNASDRTGMNWTVTGRVRGGPIPETMTFRVSRRHKAEYSCLDCGHVGWSGHRSVLERVWVSV